MPSIYKVLATVFCLSASFCYAVEDVEVEAEESVADMEATATQADLAKERLKKIERENRQALQEAERVKAVAQKSIQQSTVELTQLEKDITARKDERDQVNRERRQIERESAELTAKVGRDRKSLAKVKTAAEIARKERSLQIAKKAKLDQSYQGMTTALAKTQNELNALRTQNDKGKKDLEMTEGKVRQFRQEYSRKISDGRSEINTLRARAKMNRHKMALMEAEMRSSRKNLAALEEDVKVAESEVSESEGRLQDTEERLNQLRQKVVAREATLKQRKDQLEKSLQSHEARQAHLRMREAELGSKMARMPSSRSNGMRVTLRAAPSKKKSVRP